VSRVSELAGATIQILPIAEQYIEGLYHCLDAVARERAYLAFVQAPPLASVREFVRANLAGNVPQFVAVDGDRVVGWCDISPERHEGFEHGGRLGMGVLRAYRGGGVCFQSAGHQAVQEDGVCRRGDQEEGPQARRYVSGHPLHGASVLNDRACKLACPRDDGSCRGREHVAQYLRSA
jgi:hypothetical protein